MGLVRKASNSMLPFAGGEAYGPLDRHLLEPVGARSDDSGVKNGPSLETVGSQSTRRSSMPGAQDKTVLDAPPYKAYRDANSSDCSFHPARE